MLDQPALRPPVASLEGAGEAVCEPPPLASPRVQLRELIPSDYPILYRLAMDPALSHRWRHRSRQLTFEEFVPSLTEGVLCQFAVVSTPALEVIGHVVCYRPDFRNRFAYLALQGIPEVQHTGLVMEAAELLVDYLFACFDFHKLYAECPGFSLPQYQSGLGEIFVEEGRLRDHERFLGRTWDFSILALYRSAWLDRKRRLSARRLAGDGALAALRSLDGRGPSFDDFAAWVAEEIGYVDVAALRPESRLVEDLGADSIAFVQLVELLEDLGANIDLESLLDLETMGDLHFTLIQRR